MKASPDKENVMVKGKEGGNHMFVVFWKVWRERKASPGLSGMNRKGVDPGTPGEKAREGRSRRRCSRGGISDGLLPHAHLSAQLCPQFAHLSAAQWPWGQREHLNIGKGGRCL